MPFKSDEQSARAHGGTELMKQALTDGLAAAGRNELLEFFDFYVSRVRQFDPNRPSIYWVHELPGDEEVRHLANDQYIFDAIIFVSHWQQQEFQKRFEMARQKQVVLPNAIRMFEQNVIDKWSEPDLGSKDRPVRLIYHTTPHRGLDLLILAFMQIWEKFQGLGLHLHLDVFSSYSIYGWDKCDEPYLELFETCKKHSAINYHGAVSNHQVRDALRKAHLFTYPSIWLETSCIALIEAMASGCLCLHSNFGALPETAGGMTICYPYVPNPAAHFQLFANTLHALLLNLKADLHHRRPPGLAVLAMHRANAIYDWNNRIHDWIGFLSALKSDVESRSVMPNSSQSA